MNNLPLVSVIIPTYNRAYVLERAIQSVLKQTFKNFELIIVDDGSTDTTHELLKKYHQCNIIKTENQGVSCARNLAVTQAKGEWIAFLDSDDEWLENKLQLQTDYIKTRPDIKLVHGEEIWIRNGVRVNPKVKHKKGGGDQFIPSLRLCTISPSVAMMKKSVFIELGSFRDDYPCCEDYDLWLKFTSLYPVGFIDEFLVNKYGGHVDQLSTQFRSMDLWRVISLDWILKNRELSTSYRVETLKVILKKCEILIKGYEKHSNTEQDYITVKHIQANYIS